jgi:hypothetical protein
LWLLKSAWDAANKVAGKTDKKRNMSERSEFISFPVLPATLLGTRRAASCGRLLLLTFLGETRKVSSRRATPGMSQRGINAFERRGNLLQSLNEFLCDRQRLNPH